MLSVHDLEGLFLSFKKIYLLFLNGSISGLELRAAIVQCPYYNSQIHFFLLLYYVDADEALLTLILPGGVLWSPFYIF